MCCCCVMFVVFACICNEFDVLFAVVFAWGVWVMSGLCCCSLCDVLFVYIYM